MKVWFFFKNKISKSKIKNQNEKTHSIKILLVDLEDIKKRISGLKSGVDALATEVEFHQNSPDIQYDMRYRSMKVFLFFIFWFIC